MTDEIDTSALAGTDDAVPDQDGTAETEWTGYDPDDDDDPDTVDDPEDDATDDGTETDEEDPEGAEDEGEAEGEEDEGDDEGDAPEVADIELPDGTKVARDEVVKGYLRQSDYTRKTQEVAQERKGLQERVQSLQNIQSAFIDQIAAMVPKAPDTQLAMTDPNAYTRQKASHEAAMAQVQKIIELGQQPQQIASGLSHEDHRKQALAENERLAERFPETKDPKARKAFFETAMTAGREAGFSDEEMQGIVDHRIFTLAALASEGMKARNARKKANAKAAKAPPVSPRKNTAGKRGATARNQEAMRRLEKSGKLQDAIGLNIKWD